MVVNEVAVGKVTVVGFVVVFLVVEANNVVFVVIGTVVEELVDVPVVTSGSIVLVIVDEAIDVTSSSVVSDVTLKDQDLFYFNLKKFLFFVLYLNLCAPNGN